MIKKYLLLLVCMFPFYMACSTTAVASIVPSVENYENSKNNEREYEIQKIQMPFDGKKVSGIKYGGFISNSNNGALSFADKNSLLNSLGDEFVKTGIVCNESNSRFVLQINAEGKGLNVISTNHLNKWLGITMAVLGSSFVVNYIGGKTNNNILILSGVGLNLGSVALSLVAGMPDVSTAFFDGKYTVYIYDTEINKNVFEDSILVDPIHKKFKGSYIKDQYSKDNIEHYYATFIYNSIIEKVVEYINCNNGE
jgi:hypothetical protein